MKKRDCETRERKKRTGEREKHLMGLYKDRTDFPSEIVSDGTLERERRERLDAWNVLPWDYLPSIAMDLKGIFGFFF